MAEKGAMFRSFLINLLGAIGNSLAHRFEFVSEIYTDKNRVKRL